MKILPTSMMLLPLLLNCCLLVASSGQIFEKLRGTVLVNGPPSISFKCNFYLYYTLPDAVDLKKSRVKCKFRSSYQAIQNYNISSTKGPYFFTLSFIISRKRISIKSAKMTTTTTTLPTTKTITPTKNPTTTSTPSMCAQSKPTKTTSLYAKNMENRDQTKIAMLILESALLRNLSSQVQQDAFLKNSQENGLTMVNHCPMETLIRCNSDQNSMTNCIEKGPAKFIQCVEKITINDQKICQYCGCALGSLLGFDCNSKNMVRLMKSIDWKKEEFCNVVSTSYEFSKKKTCNTKLYMNYFGALIPEKNISQIKESFSSHASYWARKYGPISSKKQAVEALTTAETIIASADKLVGVIEKTKNIVLGNLENDIKKIKLDTEGITEESRKQMKEALENLYLSDVQIKRTRGLLETLAEETIRSCDTMVNYLGKVKDDWTGDKIALFLKFQAKKMTDLVERSLNLLKEADELYTEVQVKLSIVKANLESFKNTVVVLADANSQAHKKRIKKYRLAIYLPCCIPCPFCCAVCAVSLETTIADWKSALDALNAVLDSTGKVTGTLLTDLNETLDFLQKEIQLIIKWNGALLEVQNIDWTFPEAEIFGFADIRPEVVSSLNNLKGAAEKYLENQE